LAHKLENDTQHNHMRKCIMNWCSTSKIHT